ncbi:MAG TPA: ATP-binding cassette domain-containing protein, partial [Aldersonia sp.]
MTSSLEARSASTGATERHPTGRPRPTRTDRLVTMPEFIYTMKKVRKAHGDKVILDDVTMSFYPGAKIGVVGPNGAGKSSILKIMA